MLYENTVSGYKTFIRLTRFPAQLSLKRRYRFIMSLDCSHAWENRTQLPDPMQNFRRYRETGLNIDDKERLLHDLDQSVYSVSWRELRKDDGQRGVGNFLNRSQSIGRITKRAESAFERGREQTL